MSKIDESVFSESRMKDDICRDAVIGWQKDFGFGNLGRINKSSKNCGALGSINGNGPQTIAARLVDYGDRKAEFEIRINPLVRIRQRRIG